MWCLWFLIWAPIQDVVPSVTVKIHFSAVSSILEREVFNRDGKYYLSEQGPCRYAYLYDPVVSEQDGRLALGMTMHGRWAGRIGRNCLGPADTFSFTVTGVPVYDLVSGQIIMDDLALNLGDSFFADLIRDYVNEKLPQNLTYALSEAVTGLVTNHNRREDTPFQMELLNLNVGVISVTGDHLLIQPSFTLIAR